MLAGFQFHLREMREPDRNPDTRGEKVPWPEPVQKTGNITFYNANFYIINIHIVLVRRGGGGREVEFLRKIFFCRNLGTLQNTLFMTWAEGSGEEYFNTNFYSYLLFFRNLHSWIRPKFLTEDKLPGLIPS